MDEHIYAYPGHAANREPSADLPSACLLSTLWLAVAPSRTRSSCGVLDER